MECYKIRHSKQSNQFNCCQHTCRRFGFQGGAKKYSPYVYPPIFRGGPGVARCILRVTGVSRGMTGVSFFSNEQKKVRCIFQVLPGVSRGSQGGAGYPSTFQGGAGYPQTFPGVSWPKLLLKMHENGQILQSIVDRDP